MNFPNFLIKRSKLRILKIIKKTMVCSMFLHLRHLLIIDSLIFESCLNKSLFWLPNSQNPPSNAWSLSFRWWLFPFTTFIRFGRPLGWLWEVYRRLADSLLGSKWRFRHSLEPPWSCIFPVWASMQVWYAKGTLHYPSDLHHGTPSEPICIQKWAPNTQKSIQNPSIIHHTCMSCFK